MGKNIDPLIINGFVVIISAWTLSKRTIAKKFWS
jgi:hypothetical protein